MRVVVTGASGTLGGFVLAGRPGHVAIVGWSGPSGVADAVLSPVDLEDTRSVEAAYHLARPTVVLHLGALSAVGDCFRDPARARRVNVEATAQLARLTRADGARLIFASTDLVFDGTRPPYGEDAPPSPLSVYGHTKADAEAAVLDAGGTVVRLALLFGPGRGRKSFFDGMVDALREGRPLTLFDDEHRTPLDLASAASILWALAAHPFRGVVHAGGPDRLSRLEMGQRLAAFLGVANPVLNAVSRTAFAGEPRPADVSLDSNRLTTLLPELSRPGYARVLGLTFSDLGAPSSL